MLKYLLITALVASLIGGVATYAVTAATRTVETEVRISAQRVDDGRVEFALQQRNADGEWSDRMLPNRRFFPAEGFVNRWANSTPLTVVSDSGLDFYVNNAEPTRSLSVSQYLDFCSDPANQLATSAVAAAIAPATDSGEANAVSTWGGLLVSADRLVTAWNSVAPPLAFGEFHDAQLLGLRAIAHYAYLKPSTEEVDILELLIPTVFALIPAQTAEDALSPDVRAQLTNAGCIEESTSESADDSP